MIVVEEFFRELEGVAPRVFSAPAPEDPGPEFLVYSVESASPTYELDGRRGWTFYRIDVSGISKHQARARELRTETINRLESYRSPSILSIRLADVRETFKPDDLTFAARATFEVIGSE